ncbi:uncharacterized protein LOC119164805 [Rhipicephalus microplus]|uniref:uncharacterized protein LOC119164805 n=1 Tax=Rhipicephalus microplus TaxID=6941 RepID=UPI003F6A5FEF
MWPSLLSLAFGLAYVCSRTPSTHAQRFRSPWLHDVEHLEAQASYRTAHLRWQYRHLPQPQAFRVQTCELLPWLPKTGPRCRVRRLSLREPQTVYDTDGTPRSLDLLRKSSKSGYEALIGDLRLLTNYSVAVEPDFSSDSDANAILYGSGQIPADTAGEEDRRFQMVTSEHTLMTTKGFSARAERCLANASRVVVSTGPFFGGKIAVEDSNDDACLVYGDPHSPQDAYTLDIDHKRCGSRLVNGSKMETNIIVHENRDIITHNTRRYLVVCSFLPDTYTITASVNLPLVRGKKKSSVATHTKVPGGLLLANARLETSTEQNEVFTYQRYKDSNVRDSRIAAEQRSSTTLAGDADGTHVTGSMALALLLATTGLVGCCAALAWYAATGFTQRHRKADSHSPPPHESDPTTGEPSPASTTDTTSVDASDGEKEQKIDVGDRDEQLEEGESCVVNFITIEGKPVALLPDSTASEV